MKFVLYGHGGFYNRGCEAIVRTTADAIRKIDPQARVRLASYEYRKDRECPYHIVDKIEPHRNVRYSPPHLAAYGFRKIGLKRADLWMQKRWLSKLVRWGDVFVSVGGDNYCYEEPVDFYGIDRMIRDHGKKLVFWGASIDGELITHRMREDLKGFDLIVVRESLSYQALTKLGLANVHVCPDPAFMMEPEACALPQGWRAGNTIGLNLSPLSMRYADSSDTVQKAVFNMVGHILNSTDSAIALVPHVVHHSLAGPQNDLDALLPVYERFQDTGRVLLVSHAEHNAMQLKYIISQCSLFIGARTHATIAAYSTCVPTLVLGYSVKSRGIALDLFGELAGRVLSVKDIKHENDLAEAYKKLADGAQQTKKHLEEVMDGYIAQTQKGLDAMKGVL